MVADSDATEIESDQEVSNLGARFWLWWKDEGVESGSALCAGLVSTGTLGITYFPGLYWFALPFLLPLALLVPFLEHLKFRKKETFSSIQEENRNLKISLEDLNLEYRSRENALKQPCEEVLKEFAGLLKFTTSERITLYLYHENDKCFRPIARVSSNPQIAPLGDAIYDCKKGCLGRAWEKGHALCSAPKNITKANGEVIEDAWVKWCCKFGFSEDEARNIKFKALEYFGWRIQHGKFERKLAILMLESRERGRWDEKEVLDLLGSNPSRQSRLTVFVNTIADWRPSADVAKRRHM